MHPRALADGVWEHCSPMGCSQDWSVNTRRWRFTREPLTVRPDGKFPSKYGWMLKWMITELAAAKVTEHEVSGSGLGHAPAWGFKAYRGPKVLEITHYKQDDEGDLLKIGDLSLTFEEGDGEGKSSCEAVMSALSMMPHAGGLGFLSYLCI